MKKKALVFYDGDCSFCTASVRKLEALDAFGRLDYRNIRDPKVFEEHPEIDRRRALARMQLLAPGMSTPLEGFHAFRWIAARLPALWITVPFLWIPGASWIGTRIYDRIAGSRSCAHG
jgi:predicted DCC family thiol-disulfide oxidoreductase YuxK